MRGKHFTLLFFLTIAYLAGGGLVAGCASASGPPADRIVYRTAEQPSPALDAWPGAGAEQGLTSGDAAAGKRAGPRLLAEMSEGERRAWFEASGIYPVPWYPAPEGQSLGYVHHPTDYSWIGPALLTAGALYGVYRLYRHYDWW